MWFVVLFLTAIVFWLLYGRGAWIVYHHKDIGIVLPEDSSKESVMEELRKNLTYQFLKEIYYDENGNIAIVGKYGTYPVIISEGKLFVAPEIWESGAESVSKTVGFLAKIGVFTQRFSRDNARLVEEKECIFAYILKLFDHNAPINPHQKTATMKRAFQYKKIAIVGIILIFAIMLFIILRDAGIFGGNVTAIKESYLSEYSHSLTIGDAFEEFFTNPEWESYKDGIQEYVDFKGVCSYGGENATVIITFLMNEDTFVIDKVTVDGRNLSILEQALLLEAIYEE